MFGLSLGPTLGGLLMDALGGRGLFGLVLVTGLLGAVAFPLLRGRPRPPPAPAFRRAKRGWRGWAGRVDFDSMRACRPV